MDWRIKLGIAVLIIITLIIVVPDVFGAVFNITIDTFRSCDSTLRDVKIEGIK